MRLPLAAALFLASIPTLAQTGRSVQETPQSREPWGHSYLNRFYLEPSAGAIAFNGNSTWASGFLYGFDALRLGRMDLGISSGLIYSSLGGSVTQSTGNDNYIMQIPADIVALFGLDHERKLQVGPHIGANVIANSGHIGTFGSSPTISGSTRNQPAINPYMNVGGQALWSLSRSVGLELRYDHTFLSAFALHTFTLGVNFGIGFTA